MGFIKVKNIGEKISAEICSLLPYSDVSNKVAAKYIKAYKNEDIKKVSDFSSHQKTYYIPTIIQIEDTSDGNWNNLFYKCENLVVSPKMDTSNKKNFYSAFSSCKKLQKILQLNTSNGTNFGSMFFACYSLTTIPELDLSNGTNFKTMFSYCRKLKTIEKLIFNSAETSNMQGMFDSDFIHSSFLVLENIVIEGTIKVNSNDLNLSDCPKLTVDSLMFFINSFEDNTDDIQYTVTLGTTNLAKLTPEQIAIATSKNILLA